MAENKNNSFEEKTKLQVANQQLTAIKQQFRVVSQKLKAEDKQLETANQQLRANEEQLKRVNCDLTGRIGRLNCLYGLTELIERYDVNTEEVFIGLVDLIPPAWQYPDITCARIILGNKEFKTSNFKPTKWIQSANINMAGEKSGAIEVCYLKETPASDKGLFLTQEKKLLEIIGYRLGKLIEHRGTTEQLKATNQQLRADEQQLRAANQQLDASNQQLRASKQQLIAMNQQLKAQQGQLQSLTVKLSLSEERERKRIAGGLHDDIIQPLVFLDIKLKTFLDSDTNSELTDSYKEMRTIIKKLIGDVRDFTFDLSYPVLYELGFEKAVIQWLNSEIKEKHGLKVVFNNDCKRESLDNDMRTFLFKAVKELLVNVVKHAKANNVKVTVAGRQNNVILCVEDDGSGFDDGSDGTKSNKLAGFGLFHIREQLAYLGGNLSIQSKPDVSSKVVLTIPFENKV